MSIYDGSESPLNILGTGITPIDGTTIEVNEESVKHLLFRKNMREQQNIDLVFYDTESFYLDQKTPTDLISYTESDEVYVEILKHEYSNQEYEYEVISQDIPNYNMFWRNGIAFLGRVIVNEDVAYKGLIILQYDGTRHSFLLQKPKEVNFGTFSQEDPTSLSYNALDPAPFVFEDLVGDEASAFTYPTVIGVIPYNIFFNFRSTGNISSFAKTFSSFDKNQQMFLRPYMAIPKMPFVNLSSDNRLFRLSLERLMFPNDTPERYVLATAVDTEGLPIIDWESQALQNFLFKIYDLTESHNQVIRLRLVTEVLEDVEFEVSEGQFSNVPITDDDIYDLPEVLTNMQNTTESEDNELQYEITVNTDISNDGSTFTSVINITRNSYYITLDGNRVNDVQSKTDTYTFYNSDQRATIQRIVKFEGIDFPVNLANKSGDSYNVISYPDVVLVNITAGQHIRNVSTGTTQPIIVRGERTIDPNEMLKLHNLKNATYLTGYDRYLLLYGPYTGSNVLQFLEYDQPDYAPYPFGAIDFDYEIVHIHVHRGNIYVFTTNGLWILHSIIDYLNLQKTFAYANLDLDPSEKATVRSFGNEVFFMHQERGYVIRTNVNVISQDDVYVMPVTGPVNNILSNPNHYVKQRLEEGYKEVIDTFEDLKVTYYAKALNSNMYLYATYFIRDEVTDGIFNKKSIMLTFIYNKDSKRWTMYDTINAGYPLLDFTSGYAKGFDLLFINDDFFPYTTYGSYLNYLPNNIENRVIGDLQSVRNGAFIQQTNNTIIPSYEINDISGMLDTGALSFNSQHTKKVRRIQTTFLDIKGAGFDFYVVPYVDYLDYQNRIDVDVFTDENNDYQRDYIGFKNELGVSSILPIVTAQNMNQKGYRVSVNKMQTSKKLSLLTQLNMKGKLPGFRLYTFMNDKMKIGDYGIVYRQQKAR